MSAPLRARDRRLAIPTRVPFVRGCVRRGVEGQRPRGARRPRRRRGDLVLLPGALIRKRRHPPGAAREGAHALRGRRAPGGHGAGRRGRLHANDRRRWSRHRRGRWRRNAPGGHGAGRRGRRHANDRGRRSRHRRGRWRLNGRRPGCTQHRRGRRGCRSAIVSAHMRVYACVCVCGCVSAPAYKLHRSPI